jgi:hypothetical protein
MNLSRNDVIAGYPAAKVRNLLRHLGSTISGGHIEYAAHVLQMDGDSTNALLKQLTDEGYLELSQIGKEKVWLNTIRGNALAQAKFMKPIPRDKATRILEDFLTRVTTVNNDPYYLIGVAKVEIFGSYISKAKSVNDIDLVVHYQWKGDLSQDERVRLSQVRCRQAQGKGRRFRNIVEEVTWPTQEVKLYIRAKEPRLSLHTTDDEIVNVVEKKLVYEGPSELFPHKITPSPGHNVSP